MPHSLVPFRHFCVTGIFMCFLHIRHYVLQHKLSLYKYFKCSFFKEGSLCKSCFFHQQILLCVQFCVRLLFFRFCFVHFVYELLLFNIFPIFFMMPKYIGSPVTCSVSLYFFTIFSHCTEKSGQSASSSASSVHEAEKPWEYWYLNPSFQMLPPIPTP